MRRVGRWLGAWGIVGAVALAPGVAGAASGGIGATGAASAFFTFSGPQMTTTSGIPGTMKWAANWSGISSITTIRWDVCFYTLLPSAMAPGGITNEYFEACLQQVTGGTVSTVGHHQCYASTSVGTANMNGGGLTGYQFGDQSVIGNVDIPAPSGLGGSGGCGGGAPTGGPYDASSFWEALGTVNTSSCAAWNGFSCAGSNALMIWNALMSSGSIIISCNSTSWCGASGPNNWLNVGGNSGGGVSYNSIIPATPATGCADNLTVSGDLGDVGMTYTSTMATNDVTFPLTITWGSSVLNENTTADAWALVDNSVSSGTTITAWGKSFYTSGLVDSGLNNPQPGSVSSPWATNYAPASGDVYNPEMWCHENATSATAGGTWVDVGPLTALVNTTTGTTVGQPPGASGGSFNFGQCFSAATSGWTWYDPATWVQSGIEILSCVVQWLFIPSSTTVSGFEQTFGIASNAPTGSVGVSAWLGAVAKTVVAFPASEVSAIQSVADSGSCTSAPYNPGVTVGSHSVSMCAILTSVSGASMTSAGIGAEGVVAAILDVVVYVLAALALFHLFRRIVSGS